ncbi:MAG: helicase-exonuclease AddAB subunit AddB [Lachnospiraceae bacterium]|nr:helicase-exonuclease AddAB subunit AddB [Lachnospiraceae bacterium]
MGLRFILGRAGTGKTYKCLMEIAEKQKGNDKNIIYIVPEQFTLQAEKDILSHTDGSAMLKASVLSFKRLAYNVFSKEGGAGGRYLNDTAKIMVLRRIMAEREGDLSFFKSLADKTGFMRQLSEMIKELFSYGVTPEELIKEDNPDVFLKGKLADLSLIYKDYKEFLDSGYLADERTLDILSDKLEKSDLIKGAEIWIDGFYGFTPQEYRIIEKLLVSADTVTVTLTIDKASYMSKKLDVSSLFYETWNTANKIKEICRQNGVRFNAQVSEKASRYKRDGLLVLEGRFAGEEPAGNDHNGINIYSAADIYEEAKQTARTIVSIVRGGKYRYRDIAVLVSSPERYQTAVRSVFEEYGIPVFMDKKHKVALHPLSEAIRNVIDVIAYDFSYENMFAYLKTGFSGVSADDIDIIENYCLAYGIKGYKWRQTTWSYGKKIYDDEELYHINKLKDEITAPFEELYNKCGNNKKTTVKDICTHIMKFLKAINAAEKMAEETDRYKEEGRIDRAYENEQCWDAVMEVITDAVNILGAYEMTIREFAALFEAGITDADMGILPHGVDNVIVGDIKRSRLPEIKRLFVLGVNDSLIPSGNVTNRLVDDDERELLYKLGTELASWGKRKSFEEEFLIYGALTKPAEGLYLSYSTGTIEGAELKPSVIITKITDIFPGLDIKTADDYDEAYGIANINTAKKLIGEKTGAGEERFARAVSDALCEEIGEIVTDHIAKLNKSINKLPKLDLDIVDKVYGGSIYSSISRLERYASCPFSYFLQYNIKASDRKLYKIENPDMGSMLHEIIELFSKHIIENGLDWRTLEEKECYTIIEGIVKKISADAKDSLFSSTKALEYVVVRLERIAKRAVWSFIRHIKAGSFYPAGYEVGFGAGEDLPPVVIEIEGRGKLLLNGKIDRVDYVDIDGIKYVKVIDYKSGSKAFSLREVYYGLQLQLVLYMDSVLKYLEKKGEKVSPGGMFYYRVMDPVIKGDKELTDADIDKLLYGEFKMTGLVLKNEQIYKALDEMNFERSSIIPLTLGKDGSPDKHSSVADEDDYRAVVALAERNTAQIGKNILEGNISVSPYTNGKKAPCSYCVYKSVCLIDDGMNRHKGRRLSDKSKDQLWAEIREAYEAGKEEE